MDAPTSDGAVLPDLDRLLPDFEGWIAQVAERQSGERERLRLQHDRAIDERDQQARRIVAVEAKWTAYAAEGDDPNADLVLPMVERERQALADAETRLQALADTLGAVPTDTPTDALLDFANALQGALQGLDTTGSMAQVNTELARVFEAFVIWKDDDGMIPIKPMLRTGVAEALVQRSFDHYGSSIPLDKVFEIEPAEAPPLRWLSCPPEIGPHSQESWHLDGLRFA